MFISVKKTLSFVCPWTGHQGGRTCSSYDLCDWPLALRRESKFSFLAPIANVYEQKLINPFVKLFSFDRIPLNVTLHWYTGGHSLLALSKRKRKRKTNWRPTRFQSMVYYNTNTSSRNERKKISHDLSKTSRSLL